MLPYWAIIKDSFREALHSYVLWGLLVVLTMMLAMLLPFSYGEQLTGNLPWDDVKRWPEFLDRLKVESDENKPSPSKHIWSLLDPKVRRDIDKLWKDLEAQPAVEDEVKPEEQERRKERVSDIFTSLQRDLDRVLGEQKFYDEKAWAGVELGEEAKALMAEDPRRLSETRLRRRNRLLLEAAYPSMVVRSVSLSIRPTYMGMEIPPLPLLGAPLATTREAVVTWYRGYIGWLMNWPFTMCLVMIGIVATSGIIPRMLDPGSLSLLLSKPVTRSGLYLAKFLGGCAFMLLSATYVVVGLWLMSGIRLGIWDPQVFFCIPLFTYSFAVYFAVSALVGVLWRSAVLSILGVMVFWAVCTMFWYSKEHHEEWELDQRRIVDVIDAGDTLLAVDDEQHTYFWDGEARDWKEVFRREMPSFDWNQSKQPTVYDRENGRLISTYVWLDASRLIITRDEDAWAAQLGVPTPPLADLFVEPDGNILGVTRDGFVRIVGNPLSDGKPPEETKNLDVLQRAGPDKELAVDGPMAAAYDAQLGMLAIYAGGVLTTYKPDPKDKKQYIRLKRRELADSQQQGATLALGGGVLMIGREDGTLLLLDAKTLRETKSLKPEGDVPPRFLKASPDGLWIAVLFQNRRLWLYDVESQRLRRAGLWSQGEISGVAFNAAGSLLVADNVARVRKLELPSLSVIETYAPVTKPRTANRWRDSAYEWFVVPMYTILPRPGELGRTLNYFVTGEKTSATLTSQVFQNRDIATDRHVQRNPWTPVWTCGIFIVVMLALGCWLFQRREF